MQLKWVRIIFMTLALCRFSFFWAQRVVSPSELLKL